MKEAIVEGKRRFVVREVPEPDLDRDEVLIRIRCSGICGSDLHIFEQGASIPAGHEWSGDVVALGSEVKGWKVGERVAIEHRIYCGQCYWCRRGDIGLCERYLERLLQYRTAFATHKKVKYDQLFRLPDELTYDEAALTEPTTIALHAIRISEMKPGDAVAVLGLGPIGQLVARVARMSGAGAIYATEASRTRIDLARGVADEVIDITTVDPLSRILELTGGRGPDIVFECAGTTATTQQVIPLVRRGGVIVVVGQCLNPIEVTFSNIVLKGVTIKGSRFQAGEAALAFNLIKDRKIDVASLITHRIPLDDINNAFEKALRGEGVKILLKPQE